MCSCWFCKTKEKSMKQFHNSEINTLYSELESAKNEIEYLQNRIEELLDENESIKKEKTYSGVPKLGVGFELQMGQPRKKIPFYCR